MQGLTRYVFGQLLGTMMFVTFALTGVVWLSQSLRFVDLIVNRGLSIFTFVYLTLLLLPTFLSVILPIALFCAVVYTYHRLTIDSELVVMRAAGLSQIALARPALLLALLITLIGYSITLYFMPAGFGAFKERQFAIRDDFSHLLLQEGTFNSLATGLTVYVRARQPNGELLGILVHDTRQPGTPVTMMAERGALVSTRDGPRFVLVKGTRQELTEDGRKLGILYFDKYSLDIYDVTNANGPRWREPRERFIGELFAEPKTPGDIANRGKLLAEGHQRLVMPLYAIVFTMIGIAAMLAGEFNRSGRGRRILIAAAVAVAFQGLALALPNIVTKLPILVPLPYLNVVAWTIVATYVLVRVPTRRTSAGDLATASPG